MNISELSIIKMNKQTIRKLKELVKEQGITKKKIETVKKYATFLRK